MENPKERKPEIMPPVPDTQPGRAPEEIPQDKDAPRREAPEKGDKERKYAD